MYVIFLKSKGFNDFKYDMDMDMYNMVVMDMDHTFLLRTRKISHTDLIGLA